MQSYYLAAVYDDTNSSLARSSFNMDCKKEIRWISVGFSKH